MNASRFDDGTDDDEEFAAPQDGADPGDVRYALTALGDAFLDDPRRFAGFGPCAASGCNAPAECAPTASVPRRSRRAVRPRVTSLFG